LVTEGRQGHIQTQDPFLGRRSKGLGSRKAHNRGGEELAFFFHEKAEHDIHTNRPVGIIRIKKFESRWGGKKGHNVRPETKRRTRGQIVRRGEAKGNGPSQQSVRGIHVLNYGGKKKRTGLIAMGERARHTLSQTGNRRKIQGQGVMKKERPVWRGKSKRKHREVAIRQAGANLIYTLSCPGGS